MLAGLVAYFNSFAGVFLFDDRFHIIGERRLETLWPLWEALARRRPLIDYSLAVNHALGGDNVWGYHAVNLTIHILAALTLYGIVRRTLSGEGLRERFGPSAAWLALVVALAWVVHPLQTQAVTYLVQRAESLMGLFYLLTLYCVIRGANSSGRLLWFLAAIVSCALGMGSKAVMITAPVVLLLYDRIFLSGSVTEMLRRRWALYMGLAATWGVLWMSGVVKGVLALSGQRGNVGFGYKGATPLEYLMTQFGVLTHYLKLSFWPHPLCLDYFSPLAKTAAEIILPALLIVPLALATLWALFKKPALGFVGAWFFIILSPTSSFIPIRDPLFEHRMYLSLAAVIVFVVIGADFGLRCASTYLWLQAPVRNTMAGALTVLAIGSLTYGTIQRNKVYHSEVLMWQDVLIKRPDSPRAAENLGIARLGAGDMEKALESLREAVRVSPRSATVRNALGFALVVHGRLEEAIRSFREAVRLKPTFGRAQLNLGNALRDTGRIDEAIRHFEIAMRVDRKHSEARLNLGNALFTKGRLQEAIGHYRAILESDPEQPKAWGNLGLALTKKERLDEAINAFNEALRVDPSYALAHNGLGIAFGSLGKLDEAATQFREAVRLDPEAAESHYNLGNCLFMKGNFEGAIRHYRAAIKLIPNEPNYHYDLGTAFEKLGNLSAAIAEYERALLQNPQHPRARKALERTRARWRQSGPG